MPVTSMPINAVSTGPLTTALSNTFVTPFALDIFSETSPDGKPLLVTNMKFKLSTLYIYVTTIAAGATALTVQISSDPAGDLMLIPATTAALAPGFTTPTKGSIVLRVDVDTSIASDKLFFTLKTDVGTCTLVELVTLFDR